MSNGGALWPLGSCVEGGWHSSGSSEVLSVFQRCAFVGPLFIDDGSHHFFDGGNEHSFESVAFFSDPGFLCAVHVIDDGGVEGSFVGHFQSEGGFTEMVFVTNFFSGFGCVGFDGFEFGLESWIAVEDGLKLVDLFVL